MSAGKIPKWEWGAAFANTVNVAYPLNEARSWSEPRQGSEWHMAPSGEEDAWIVGRDYLLGYVVDWIPTADRTEPNGNAATGWDGATGWDAFLDWLRRKNEGRFYPDKDAAPFKTFKLREPMRDPPEVNDDGSKRLRMVIRATDAAAFTGY